MTKCTGVAPHTLWAVDHDCPKNCARSLGVRLCTPRALSPSAAGVPRASGFFHTHASLWWFFSWQQPGGTAGKRFITASQPKVVHNNHTRTAWVRLPGLVDSDQARRDGGQVEKNTDN